MKPTLMRLVGIFAATTIIVGTFAGTALAQEDPASPVPAESVAPAPAEDGEKLTFTVGTTGDMVSANPFKACCSAEYEMMFLAYDMLHNFDPNTLEAAPGLAESYEVSEDGKTWTFKIREGVKWSDGEPVTAEDVAFTFNFINDNDGMGTFNNYLGDPKSFSAPDPTTFVWEMETATTSPLTPPWLPIVPKHIWEKFDGLPAKDIKAFRNVPAVSSGPFVLEEWKPGEFWRMSANKEYWGGAPYIDEVIFRVFENQEAMVQALQNGEIDAAEAIEPALFDSLKNDPNIEAVKTNENYYYNFAFNLKTGKSADGTTTSTSHPALQDLNVRKALAHSVDKQTLVDTLLSGYGSVGDSFILPVYSDWYKPAEGDQIYEFSLEEANRLYDEGGYVDTDGDGIREMPGGGEPFEFDLYSLSDDSYSTDAGKLIKGWMEQTGWKVNLIPVSESKMYDVWYASDFDAYLWGFGGDPDPDFISSIFTTDQCGVWSDGCYSNPEYDALWEKQHTQTNLEDRQKTMDEIQDFFYADVPQVINFYINDTQAYRKDRWTGFVPQPAPNGSIIYGWGPYSYQSIKPVTAADGTDVSTTNSDGGGIPTIAWIAIAAVVVIIIGVVVARMRRKDDEDQA